MSNQSLKIFCVTVFLFTTLLLLSCRNDSISEVIRIDGEMVLVQRVIDGDTFELPDGRKVRLLGIDTPEKFNNEKLKNEYASPEDRLVIMKLGELSSDYVTRMIEGKEVILVPEENYEDTDRYGRLLRYVYLPDGTLINAKIIEDGFGEVYEKYPVSKTNEFRSLQVQARENSRGLWGDIEGLKNFR
ncbi:MAG: thermonuclease family protein [Ignavibacteriaceae bacterium]|nr:thermonuclease family protein [Ignavibacteriaceae bacterium]